MAPGINGRFRAWTAAMLVLGAAFAGNVLPQLRLQTDILALLPAQERDPALNQALAEFSDRGGRKAVFLVGAAHLPEAEAAARRFAEVLRGSGVFRQVRVELDAALTAAGRSYLPYRYGLLSTQHRRQLAADDLDGLRRDALHALYTPAGFARPFGVAEDPLGLLGSFTLGQTPSAGAARPAGAVLAVNDAQGSYVLVAAEIDGSAFALDVQERSRSALEAATAAARAAEAAVEVLGSGVILHAAAAAQRAQTEMALFGTVSLIGVVALLLLTFRSVQPLLLSAVSLGCGAMAGLSACQWLFGEVHLLTLVFGSSLIGVSVDYSTHFFADRFRDPAGWTPQAGFAQVGLPILIGHVTAVLGYLGLLVAPFPGLRQIAVFSAAGLVVACGCVLCLYPRLASRGGLSHQPATLRLARALGASRFRFRASPAGWAIAAGLVALAAAGLGRLEFADDVRLLQSSPPALLASEARVRALLDTGLESRFFLVQGESAEQVLQREEALSAALDATIARGALLGYTAVSQSLPSQQRQAENRALLARGVYAKNGLLRGFLRTLGFGDAAIAARLDEFRQPQRPLTPPDWQASVAAEPYRHLWLGRIGERHASAVMLRGVRDGEALRALATALPGVRWVDKLGEVSAVLERYRRLAIALIAAVYGGIALLLSLRYGLGGALRLLVPPVGGSLLALAMLGLIGVPANLFNVLSLLLVLGMGVDYAIFLREGRAHQTPVLLAILLSTAATLLSFGLLAASATPFIRAIGLTLALGIGLVFLLAVWLGRSESATQAPPLRLNLTDTETKS